MFVGGGGGDAAEVSVFEAVGVAAQVDDFGVVDEAVDHRGSDDVVAEDLAPASEGLVAGDDEGGSFVAGGDELEEQVRGLGFERDVADLVDDQQRVASEAAQLVLQAAVVVGAGEAVDPLGGGREQDPVPGLAGADRDAGGEVGLAGAGRSEEDDVVLGGDEVEGAQVRDQVASQAAGVVEVELLEGLACRGTSLRGSVLRRRGTRGRTPRVAGRRRGTPRRTRTAPGPGRPGVGRTRARSGPSTTGSGMPARY